ncbi:hypothetical protein KGY71_06950, partial [Candidatus Bipolaricaulota bacterium]|nr:hypothetical protein [Candidatus Bipolaricaulota bacterium]
RAPEKTSKIEDIPVDWPKEIVRVAQMYYYDNQTDNLIAVGKRNYEGRKRDIMVAFEEAAGELVLITIHPLKTGQKERRIKKDRWTKYEKK